LRGVRIDAVFKGPLRVTHADLAEIVYLCHKAALYVPLSAVSTKPIKRVEDWLEKPETQGFWAASSAIHTSAR
jgi:hypothetical protein